MLRLISLSSAATAFWSAGATTWRSLRTLFAPSMPWAMDSAAALASALSTLPRSDTTPLFVSTLT